MNASVQELQALLRDEDAVSRMRHHCVDFFNSEQFQDYFTDIHLDEFTRNIARVGGVFRKDFREALKNRGAATPELKERYRQAARHAPIVLARIVMANTAVLYDGQSSPALVVIGWGGEEQDETLDEAASRLGMVHFHYAETAEDKALAKQIEDETYRFGTRRRLPEWLVGNQEIYAADLWIPGMAVDHQGLQHEVLFCLAQPGPSGLLTVIPGNIVQMALNYRKGPPPPPTEKKMPPLPGEASPAVDVATSLQRALLSQGIAASPVSAGLDVVAGALGLDSGSAPVLLQEQSTGMTIRPELHTVTELRPGAVQTCTTLHCYHPRVFPDGIFEYQHSVGDSGGDSIEKGFVQWAQLDFPALQDACSENPENCSSMEMEFPEQEDGSPGFTRRVVLGPVMHMGINQGEDADPDRHESGCPCCLLTNSMEAFADILKMEGRFFAIRLFAMRNDDGSTQADCRINGEEYEEGKAALAAYANTWPQMGFETRKQYVVLC